MKIPEEYGGLGLSQVYYNKALAMAGTWHSSISTLLSAHQSIGLPEPLRLFGSEEQKRQWLPKLASDHISAFLLTEPDVGSDPARMSTTAVPTDDGTGYRINGTKLWATNGAIADVVVIMAVVPKSDGHRGGITAFLCPCDRDGHHDRAPQRVHGAQGHRELGDALRRRLRPHRGRHRAARARGCGSRSPRSTPGACRCRRSACRRRSTR